MPLGGNPGGSLGKWASGLLGADSTVFLTSTGVPGGQVGGTFANMTINSTHSGSTHESGGTGLNAATQADMETGTSTSVAVTPLVAQNHPGIAKTLGTVEGSDSTSSLRQSYNIASVAYVAIGRTTVTHDIDFGSTGYTFVAGGPASSFVRSTNLVVGSFELQSYESTDASTLIEINQNFFACYGDRT